MFPGAAKDEPDAGRTVCPGTAPLYWFLGPSGGTDLRTRTACDRIGGARADVFFISEKHRNVTSPRLVRLPARSADARIVFGLQDRLRFFGRVASSSAIVLPTCEWRWVPLMQPDAGGSSRVVHRASRHVALKVRRSVTTEDVIDTLAELAHHPNRRIASFTLFIGRDCAEQPRRYCSRSQLRVQASCC